MPPPGQRGGRKNKLVQGTKKPSGSGWMGCVVVLIFLAAVFFNSVESLVRALLDLVR